MTLLQVSANADMELEEITRILRANSIDMPDGCWEWTAGKSGNGYPQYYYNGQYINASKLALLAALKRPIRQGMQAFHTCYKRYCVNPAHSQEETPADIRMLTRDRQVQSAEGVTTYSNKDLTKRVQDLTRRVEALEEQI